MEGWEWDIGPPLNFMDPPSKDVRLPSKFGYIVSDRRRLKDVGHRRRDATSLRRGLYEQEDVRGTDKFDVFSTKRLTAYRRHKDAAWLSGYYVLGHTLNANLLRGASTIDLIINQILTADLRAQGVSKIRFSIPRRTTRR
jgi:hypothetical protein